MTGSVRAHTWRLLSPGVWNYDHRSRMGCLRFGEMQQEGVRGQTEELGPQMLNSHVSREFSIIQHDEARIPEHNFKEGFI